jgi:hypothetical protein
LVVVFLVLVSWLRISLDLEKIVTSCSFGKVQYGVVCSCVVIYGMVWYDIVQYGIACRTLSSIGMLYAAGMVQYVMIRCIQSNVVNKFENKFQNNELH